jgi:hypothetical protein
VIERIVTWPVRTAADIGGRVALAGLDAVLASRYTDEAVRRTVESQALERAVTTALESPELERLVQTVVNSPAMERLVAQAVDSRLVDAVVEQLLESEELWVLVDEIARSPAVTEAISHQSIGFADQVAGELRSRSVKADATVERVVRRVLRRRPPTPRAQLPPPSEEPTP